MKKNIFIFDQNKCVACHACVVACMNENGFQSKAQWRKIYHSDKQHFLELPLFYISIACNHCDDAPCLINCPALAFNRDDNTGAVIHDPLKCIGCKYCTWACPFDAPKYNSEIGIIEKCTFCNHRIEDGMKPACTELCPVGALEFEHMSFSRIESVQSSPVPVDVGSNLKIIELRKKSGPEQDLNIFSSSDKNINDQIQSDKITAKKEWPLILFTLLSAVLVSLYASQKTDTFGLTSKMIFFGGALISLGISVLHLGKIIRSWRSVLNIRHSWISREIVSLLIFYLVVFIDLLIYDIPNLIGVMSGLFFLFSIDMIYSLASWNWPVKIHSSQTVLIAFTLTGLMSEAFIFLYIVVFIRFCLYIFRSFYSKNRILPITFIRIILLFSPFILLFFELNIVIVFLLLLSGDCIDRIEFYNELNVPDPNEEFHSQNLN